MYIDDMPMWALVGDFGQEHNDKEKPSDEMYIWTHKTIDIGYNGNRIVDVNVTTGKRVLLKPGVTLHFSYEVRALVVLIVYFFGGEREREKERKIYSGFKSYGNMYEHSLDSGLCFVPVADTTISEHKTNVEGRCLWLRDSFLDCKELDATVLT